MKMEIVGILIVIAIATTQSYALACKECHSKNPKMLKMHKELEYKDCFTCHGPAAAGPIEERKIQRASDPVCSKCHEK
ncbi:MAG: hypothetical protein A2X59_06695 [Nitrospirae bacterium GWC2_42_7]|nr:MAG: hypothetical protein A2X59_06695 [Nitrospirae bacterium GWC2_42_7]